MGEKLISGRIIAAGRSLAGIARADFAAAAGLSEDALISIESGGSALVNSAGDAQGLLSAFDHFGVLIVDETTDLGAGVRLKFTRQDVQQLATLESEGGIIGSDDAP